MDRQAILNRIAECERQLMQLEKHRTKLMHPGEKWVKIAVNCKDWSWREIADKFSVSRSVAHEIRRRGWVTEKQAIYGKIL